jgi:1-acyl-sn-glycerol-3-phosphate acyltransferase
MQERRLLIKVSVTNKLLTTSTTHLIQWFLLGNIKGQDNLQFDGPKIIISNHSSYLDHFVILKLLKKYNPKQKVYFLTKQEAFDKPFSKWWHFNLNCVPVDRDGNATAAMKTLKNKLIKESATVVIYPEGTRTPTGEIYLGKSGAEILALMTGVPIIPIGMHGLYDILPKKELRPTLNKVNVEIGKSLYVHKEDKHNIETLTNNHMEIIADLAHERLSTKHVGEFDVKQEALDMIINLNSDALRNYPNALHSPNDYHKRVLYMGRHLLSETTLNNDEKVLVLVEMARAEGRIAANIGLKTYLGKVRMKQVKNLLHQAKEINADNPEVLYVEGNFYNFIEENQHFVSCLEKAVKYKPCSIRYRLSLAKAYKTVGRLEDMTEVLRQIGQLKALSQVDSRRKVEALALLMRIDPSLEMEFNYGK